MAQRNPSKITTDYAVDDPLVQGAVFEFDADDRQYLDNQIRGCQQRIVDLHAAGGGGTSVVARTTKTATYTILATDFLVILRTNTFTTNLPASPVDGETHEIKNRAPTANTLAGNGHNIDGAASYSIPAGSSVKVSYDLSATEWVLLG